MTLDKAKALTLSLFPSYPWALVVERNRLIFETMEDLIGKGYVHKPFSPITDGDRTAAEKAVEAYAFNSPNWEPRDITSRETNLWEMSIIMGLLRNPPATAPTPSEGYTQADMDAAAIKGVLEGFTLCQLTVTEALQQKRKALEEKQR